MSVPKKAVPSLSSLMSKNPDSNVDETGDAIVKTDANNNAVNKTPAELAAETPTETEERYNINTQSTEEDLDNPRVQVYRDSFNPQIISGTHLHPDIAKDAVARRNIDTATENGTTTHMVTQAAYADESENDDKGFVREDIKEAVDHSENPEMGTDDNK